VETKLNNTILERKAYLAQIERDIESVTKAGSEKLQDVYREIEMAENEKAKLLQELFGIRQQIREHKTILSSL
jgi:hypothetical protein